MHVTALFFGEISAGFSVFRKPGIQIVRTHRCKGKVGSKVNFQIMLNASRKRESLNKFDINKPNIPRSVQAHQYCPLMTGALESCAPSVDFPLTTTLSPHNHIKAGQVSMSINYWLNVVFVNI